MAIERKHYGTSPIESLEGVDIFRRDKLSYARFLYALPGIIASKFPVEETFGNDVYRLEVGKIKVGANFQGDEWPWIDEKSYISSKRQCIDNRETLSYNLDGEVRLFKNGSLKESCYRHLFPIPAMTSTGSFIIKGEEKALKTERSLDGLTYTACGELLRDLFKQCDFSDLHLADIAEERNGMNISNFEFSVAGKVLNSGFSRSNLMIPVNGTNPYSTISTKTAILSKKNTGEIGELKWSTMDLRDTGYNPLDFLFLSFVEKKEGAKLSENFNEAIGFEVGPNRQALIPVHPVRKERDATGKIRHVVSGEVVKITTEDLMQLRGKGSFNAHKGKTIANYMTPGTEIAGDCPVMTFSWERERTVGKEKQLYDSDFKGQIKAESGKAEDLGYPDYVPVRPGNISVVELTGAWSSIVNPTREAMGTAHAKQAMALTHKSIPRITSGCEKAVVKATEAALFAKESGKVVSVNEHEIAIQGERETLSYPLDDVIMKSSSTDMRYTSIVKAGDKVIKGQCIADGPFTLQGELCMGATDLITAMIPYTAMDDKKRGLFRGSNNNDALIISESAAKKFEKKEISKIYRDIVNRGWGSTTFGVPIVDGKPDERFDAKTGLPKKGAIFHIGDTILDVKLPDSTQSISVLESLASEDKNFGRISDEQKTKVMADLVVEDVRVAKDMATVYLSFTRSLECGDKITLGHGQKATVAAILPDSEMPTVEIKGKTIPVDIIPDPISFVKRVAPIGIEGTLRLGLIVKDEYAKVGVGEKNLPKISCNLADELGLPIDGMYPVKLSNSIDPSVSYLMGNAQASLSFVVGMDGMANKEARNQQNIRDTNSADRMTGGAVLQGAPLAQDELFNNPAKINQQQSVAKTSGIKIKIVKKGLEF